MAITLIVLCAQGHRKYAPMTPEETQDLVSKIAAGKVEGLQNGPYFVINKNTKRVVGKIGIQDNQELIMVPLIRGG